MSDRNWRNEVNAQDYFGHQKKQLQFADRRPVIRKASDLVGPGVGASATRITDFSDTLATFDGYFSAAPGTSNAPNSTDAFVGFVSSDSEFGGTQIFTAPATGTTYQRSFTRAVLDPSTLYWSDWQRGFGGDTDWANLGAAGSPAFLSGWEAHPGGFAPPAFRRLSGMVHFRGLIRSGVVGSAVFYLPGGFRPSNLVLLATISENAIGRVVVFSSGEVRPETPSSDAWVSLDGLSFVQEG